MCSVGRRGRFIVKRRGRAPQKTSNSQCNPWKCIERRIWYVEYSHLTEDTSATVIQDTLDTIKAMEITEATLDIIENLVNIVTHTKCIDCINHIKVKTV